MFIIDKINLSSFNTYNVTDMSYMFSCCESFTKLDLSNFNTDKVTNMEGIFDGCIALEELNLSIFNTENAIMHSAFCGCSKLENIKIDEKKNSTLMLYFKNKK